jgi:hypothetical protein
VWQRPSQGSLVQQLRAAGKGLAAVKAGWDKGAGGYQVLASRQGGGRVSLWVL